MADVPNDIYDRMWDILESSAVVVSLTRVGNRSNNTKAGWFKSAIAGSPADFRRIVVTSSRFRHPMWTGAGGFGAEDDDFLTDAGCDFYVDRTEEIVVTLREELAKDAGEAALREAVLAAIYKSGPRLGSALVLSVGEVAGDTRETIAGERPFPGRVTTMRIPIATRQGGRSLLV